MLDIVQPKNDDVDEDAIYDEVLPNEKYAQNQPIIPVSRESNEPIEEWTDNKTLLIGAFPDKFLFGQSVPNGLPTQQNWKHFWEICQNNAHPGIVFCFNAHKKRLFYRDAPTDKLYFILSHQ
jgi:hypothetical protein